MGNNETKLEFFSLSQAADYAHVTRQAIYLAIKHRGLKATKMNGKWNITVDDLNDYRTGKYNRDLRKDNGEYIFDVERGHFSVPQVCKVLSSSLGRIYSLQRIYYLLRTGQLKGFRRGKAWIVERSDAIALLEEERGHIQRQMGML